MHAHSKGLSESEAGKQEVVVMTFASVPDESCGIGHDSVRVIFILGYVMDEGEDELHTRLHQHHIRCRSRGRRERNNVSEAQRPIEVNVCLWGLAKPGSLLHVWRQPEASWVKKTHVPL